MTRILKVISREERVDPHSSDGPLPFEAIGNALIAALEGDAESGAVDALDFALRQAILYRASDLHLEPWQDCLALRFRVDGILHDVAQLPRKHHARLVARTKILARLISYQCDIPQDGRIDAEATPCNKALRVSTFPTVNGERVVIRVLDSAHHRFDLDELGFGLDIARGLRDIVRRPQGTLLLTGPSSSGKTTTIYALLRELLAHRSPIPHVVTIEDPVEYRLDRIAQTELSPHSGLSFEAALRSLLRQDPEVIVVGEIRDADTARTAIQAGLTGHLVISTIHSGVAAGVFTRLLDMGIEPFLVASSVTGVLAQRLVRVTCPRCAAPCEADPELAACYGLDDLRTQRKGAGCGACNGIGYSGRTALGELLTMNEEMADLVLSRARTSVLNDAALRRGMVSIEESGRAAVKAGMTTVEELRRVLPTRECR
ncbi:MAG: general secretion pathway protein GspE [Candidatus Hydrogenedentota bacterium]